MSTTPPRSMPTPSPDMSVADYRLLQVERQCDGVQREVKKLHEALIQWRASDKMDMAMAIERCGSHGKRIEDMEHKFERHLSDESTAVVRVVQHEMEKREFQQSRDTPARWGVFVATLLATLGAVMSWIRGGGQ
jgi:hypothetical protein